MSECIEHSQKGSRTRTGQPQGYGSTSYKGQGIKLHRMVYCRANAVSVESIVGLVIRHTCDNPRCINPDHLLLGTPQDNADDKVTRGRQSKGRDSPHAVLTPHDVKYIRDSYVKGCRVQGSVALSRELGVCQSTIYKAVCGETWKHL